MNVIKQVEKILEMTVNEKLNAIYEKHKENFPNSFFHNLLWKLMIDKTREGMQSALTPIVKSGYTEIGIADYGKRGYTPTSVVFATSNYYDAEKICNDLNKEIFGLDEKQANDIIFSTMRS